MRFLQLFFTSCVINSLILLSISPILLVLDNDGSIESSDVSKDKYAIGFLSNTNFEYTLMPSKCFDEVYYDCSIAYLQCWKQTKK